MQEDAAHKLHIKSPKTQSALCGFPTVCKCLWQQVVQRLSIRHSRFEFGGLFDQPFIAEFLEFRFKCVDLIDQRARRLHFAVVRRSEHLARDIP